MISSTEKTRDDMFHVINEFKSSRVDVILMRFFIDDQLTFALVENAMEFPIQDHLRESM